MTKNVPLLRHVDRRSLARLSVRAPFELAPGRVEVLGHIVSAEMAPGDVFVIETPGDGRYRVA